MSININIKVDDNLISALQEFAELKNKTISEVVIEAIKEKLEDEDDYKDAMDAYESVDMSDVTTLTQMCAKAGIDYKSL